MPKEVVATSVRLPEDLYATIVAWAGQDDRTINGQIVYLLRLAIQRLISEGREPA